MAKTGDAAERGADGRPLIYGIAGIARSSVFVANARYVFGGLRSWGWVTLILGILLLAAAGGVVAVVGLRLLAVSPGPPARRGQGSRSGRSSRRRYLRRRLTRRAVRRLVRRATLRAPNMSSSSVPALQ